MKYNQVYDGEWVRPNMTGYKVRCCDCGLVHTVIFRVVDGEVEYQISRNERATGQVRRHMPKAQVVECKHEFALDGGPCIHCGKTVADLMVKGG